MRGIKTLIIAAAALLAAACAPQKVPPPSGPIVTGPGSSGGMCGGIAGFACQAEGDYCRMDEGQCRMPDAAGSCTPKTEMCTREYNPVCGCDGKTYGNACTAAAAGVSVLSKGECPPAG